MEIGHILYLHNVVSDVHVCLELNLTQRQDNGTYETHDNRTRQHNRAKGNKGSPNERYRTNLPRQDSQI